MMRGILLSLFAFLISACGGSVGQDAITQPLEGAIGSAEDGAAIFAARTGGHCVLCHMVSGLDAEFQGNIGPELSAVGSRLTPAQLRLRIVDYDRVKPGTTMPPYYRTNDLHQVAPDYAGKTLLSAQDIEDIIAYLAQQKDTSL